MAALNASISLKEYIKLNPTKRLAALTFIIVAGLCSHDFYFQEGEKTKKDDKIEILQNKITSVQASCDSQKIAMVQVYEREMKEELRAQIADIKAGLAQREEKLDRTTKEAERAIETNRNSIKILKKTNSRVANLLSK